jgi:hypothetical protein
VQRDDAKVTIHNLAYFAFGELPGDAMALLLGYATSPEKLAKKEIDTFVIGMTREKSAELGRALLLASAAPSEGGAPPSQH